MLIILGSVKLTNALGVVLFLYLITKTIEVIERL